MTDNIKKFQINKFFQYVSIPSQSVPGETKIPTSKGQMELAKVLANELKELGLKDIKLNDNSIVTALLPKTKNNVKSVGFVAHLDTVDVGLSPNINPQILKFSGEDICLNKDLKIYLKVNEHPEIKKYINEDIIFTDGTSVLGADNKAAIATIISMLKVLIEEKREHGDIYIAFVPDEEIGLLGAKALDLNVFKPDFAYTIDCCELGEIVYETSNSAGAIIDIEGVTAHTMNSKGIMVNPILIAVDIINNFDRKETPEHTDPTEGCIWINGIKGDQKTTRIKISIGDHNKNLFEEKKERIRKIVEKVRNDYPKATIKLKIEDRFGNIADCIKDDRYPIDLIYKAMENLNIESRTITMRGGTDGSALSTKGLLTPNYFTGAHNFHSQYEFLPLSSFHKSLELSLEIINLASR